MGGSLNLGRLFGIRISLDWSLIFIFVLVLFSLGAGVFPAWHPEWSPALVWGISLAAAILFFASVLAHELSHALVGRAYGIPVRSITLFLFGGMANIENDPDSPKAEALMAAVGPITSIVLGIVFLLIGSLATPAMGDAASPAEIVRRMGPLPTLLAWLGPVNILLGVFNLLPGFPLDGGRVFRALLWGITKDLNVATRWASRVGQGFGWLLALIGIAMAFGARVPIFGTGLVGGLWLAFIGWFLSSAAAASYRQLIIKNLLQDIPVSRLMRRQMPSTIPSSIPISDLVYSYIMAEGETTLAVTEGNRIVGIVRSADVRKVARDEWERTPVRHIAAQLSDVPRAHPDEDAFQALQRIGRVNVDDLVVVDDGEHVVGLLRRQDLMRWLELQSQDRQSTPPSLWRPAQRPGR